MLGKFKRHDLPGHPVRPIDSRRHGRRPRRSGGAEGRSRTHRLGTAKSSEARRNHRPDQGDLSPFTNGVRTPPRRAARTGSPPERDEPPGKIFHQGTYPMNSSSSQSALPRARNESAVDLFSPYRLPAEPVTMLTNPAGPFDGPARAAH